MIGKNLPRFSWCLCSFSSAELGTKYLKNGNCDSFFFYFENLFPWSIYFQSLLWASVALVKRLESFIASEQIESSIFFVGSIVSQKRMIRKRELSGTKFLSKKALWHWLNNLDALCPHYFLYRSFATIENAFR